MQGLSVSLISVTKNPSPCIEDPVAILTEVVRSGNFHNGIIEDLEWCTGENSLHVVQIISKK